MKYEFVFILLFPQDSIGITTSGMLAFAKWYTKKDSDTPTFTLTYSVEKDAIENFVDSLSTVIQQMKK